METLKYLKSVECAIKHKKESQSILNGLCKTPEWVCGRIDEAVLLLKSYGFSADAIIFCVALWICPSALCGGKLRKGTRREIANAVGAPSELSVTQRLARTRFYFNHYAEFRNDVEKATEIAKMKLAGKT